LAIHWQIRPDTLYLNHGSFGLSPWPVKAARRKTMDALDAQPMDFYLRQFESDWGNCRSRLADFVGTRSENLVFVENSTYGVNVVAESFVLRPGDEVILNNHEYGAVSRIWQRKCQRSGAKIACVTLPETIQTQDQVVDSIFAAVTDRTRLIVVSHITSPTALVMPVEQICAKAMQYGVAVCVDGPHAPVQIDFQIDQLQCDFYTASCHKWLCAPLGSGFLYVHPKWHANVEPLVKSWGRLLPAMPESWDQEFIWSGTRDPSAFLGIAAAIDFIQYVGVNEFQQRTRWLADYDENL
jgi:isopenicillin-N epimerase